MLWPGLIYWLHQDADGIPWLLVSRDFPGNDVIRDTLRLDFDATGIKGRLEPGVPPLRGYLANGWIRDPAYRHN